MAVCQRIAWLVFASNVAESHIAFSGWCRATFAGHCGICWVHVHGALLVYYRENHLKIHVLCYDAIGLLVYGHFLGKDDEESAYFGGEKLRYK